MGCICDRVNKKSKNDNTKDKRLVNLVNELLIKGKDENNQIDFDTVDKIKNSICKIKIHINNKIKFGTGFFIIYQERKFLITCFHVINLEVKEFEIEIWNKKTKMIELKNRYFNFIERLIDITVIEINNNDDFIEDIEFLDYDLNYLKGYSQYKNIEVFSLGYPNGEKLKSDSGIIKEIDGPEFYHNINTQTGSSGSPIILFTTLKVIGVHKQGIIELNLNVGTFIGEILNAIGEPKINNKTKIKEDNKIDIEIIDEYKCIIYYKLLNKVIKDLGFLIKIPLGNNQSITGLITKYHIEENILNKIKEINIYKSKQLLEKLNSEFNFIFSDDFLNVSFIEIKTKNNYDFIKTFEGKDISENITLINYSQNHNSINQTFGKFIEKWGISIKYKANNNNSMYVNSGLLINNKLVGIHKKSYIDYNIAINIDIIIKAIKLNYLEKNNNNLDNLKESKYIRFLAENHAYDLLEKGLVLTGIPNLFISPRSVDATPIWFLRTKHAWYWTPTKPDNNDFDLANWMIIVPNNTLKVIGGYWDGKEPVKRNIDLIHWLEKSKLIYCA